MTPFCRMAADGKSRVGQPWKSAKPDKTGRTARLVTEASARRELEDLRAAINHHRREGLCSEIVEVVLPEKPRARERWLTRKEAAKLLWTAHRARQPDANTGLPTKRATATHIARFVLVGLYTGTRAGAICGASLNRISGRGYIDIEAGVFYRRAAGAREAKKRQPPVRLPARLLAHLRRWGRLGKQEAIAEKAAIAAGEKPAPRRFPRTAVVEWNGRPIGRVNKAFAKVAGDAELAGVFPAHAAAHRRHLVDAEPLRFLGGSRFSRYDGRDARGELRPPPPRSSERSHRGDRPARQIGRFWGHFVGRCHASVL